MSFFFFWPCWGVWSDPGQESDLNRSLDLSLNCGNTRSLIHCAELGIKPHVPALLRCCWSLCTTVGTLYVLFLFQDPLWFFILLSAVMSPLGCDSFSDLFSGLFLCFFFFFFRVFLLRLFLFFVGLSVLRITGQVFCRMPLYLTFSHD